MSILWALTSIEGEGPWCGHASFTKLPLPGLTIFWLVLWPSLGLLSCSGILTSEEGLAALREPNPDPSREDCSGSERQNPKDMCSTAKHAFS